MEANFDIDRYDLYLYNEPTLEKRTRDRLTQMAELGMEEVSTAEFGIYGVMSGLYIEKVWRYSDKEFDEYMDWVKSLIKKHKQAQHGNQ